MVYLVCGAYLSFFACLFSAYLLFHRSSHQQASEEDYRVSIRDPAFAQKGWLNRGSKPSSLEKEYLSSWLQVGSLTMEPRIAIHSVLYPVPSPPTMQGELLPEDSQGHRTSFSQRNVNRNDMCHFMVVAFNCLV